MRSREVKVIGLKPAAWLMLVCVGLTLGLAGAPCVAMASTDREVGVTSVVNTKAEGTPPTSDTRPLATGTKMYFEEKVVTNETGRAQLLFADGSSMTVGPNSDLVIDTFIYNPDTKVGEMTIGLTKGFVRFVGGRISKRKPVKIKTPIGSIGIRGGIAMVEMQPGQGMTADFLFGQEMTVEVGNTVQTTTTPGTFLSADATGETVSAPAKRDPSELNSRLKSFENQDEDSNETSENNEQAGSQTANSNSAQQSSDGQEESSQQSDNQASSGQNSENENEGSEADSSETGGAGTGGAETESAQIDTAQTEGDQTAVGELQGSSGGSNDQLALIDTGISGLSDDETGAFDAPDITSAPPGTGGPQSGETTLPSDGGGDPIAQVLDPVVDTPQPRPEEEQTTTFFPPPDPTIEPDLDPLPGDPSVTSDPIPEPEPEPTDTVLVLPPPEPEPEPEPEPPQQSTISFSRLFSGFAIRGDANFTTLGANTTNSTLALADRRFTSVTVGGSDNTVGGNMTATSIVGDYGLFYPAPSGGGVVDISQCPNSLDCSAQLAGVTPTTLSGPIEFGADPEFVVYALNVDNQKSLIALGTEYLDPMPTLGAARYNIRADSFLAGGLSFLRSTDTGFPAPNDTDLFVKWSSLSGFAPFMASRFEIDAVNSKSSISVLVGDIIKEPSAYLDGAAIGQVDLTGGASEPEIFYGSVFSADTDSGSDFFGISGPNHFVLTSVEDEDTGTVEAGMVNADLTPAGPYFPVNTVSIAGPHTVDASNTKLVDVPLIGYLGGAGTVTGIPGAYVASTEADPTFLSITSSSDLPFASIDVTADGISSMSVDSGAFGAYVDDRHFATELFSGATSANPEATFTIGYLVTAGNNSLGFDLCSVCEFLSWGFWGVEQLSNDVVFHMASWVAGVATEFATLGILNAAGTYNGNVVGSIIDATGAAIETRVQTGTFSLDVSLAGASSTVTLNSFNFDGLTPFTSTATAFDATSQYYALSSTDGINTLDMRGAFFGTDGANIPPETGGDFKITGPSYNAAGVFAARK